MYLSRAHAITIGAVAMGLAMAASMPADAVGEAAASGASGASGAAGTAIGAPHALSPLITACQACHGREGVSVNPDIPNLAGQKENYLVHQLEAFRKGERKNDLMAAIAAQLSDADIKWLASNWSQMRPATSASAPPSAAPIHSRMSLPADFPKGFVVYETSADVPQGNVALRYANDIALRALRAGKPLPSGAALVTATHALALDAAGKPVLDATGQPSAGALQSYAAMELRAGWGEAVPQLLRNGDWDYALFGADGTRRDALNQAACLACHKPVAADSYVFTMRTLRDFATSH